MASSQYRVSDKKTEKRSNEQLGSFITCACHRGPDFKAPLTLSLQQATVAWEQPFADFRGLGLSLLYYLLYVLKLTLELLILDGFDIDAEAASLETLTALLVILATLPEAAM